MTKIQKRFIIFAPLVIASAVMCFLSGTFFEIGSKAYDSYCGIMVIALLLILFAAACTIKAVGAKTEKNKMSAKADLKNYIFSWDDIDEKELLAANKSRKEKLFLCNVPMYILYKDENDGKFRVANSYMIEIYHVDERGDSGFRIDIVRENLCNDHKWLVGSSYRIKYAESKYEFTADVISEVYEFFMSLQESEDVVHSQGETETRFGLNRMLNCAQ